MALVEIILLAMVAGFILLRLRGELGKRPGNDDHHQHGSSSTKDENAPSRFPAKYSNEMPSGDVTEVLAPSDVPQKNDQSTLVDISADISVRNGLSSIRQIDKRFEAGIFMAGAKEAYGIILEAFWSGDKEALKDLVADSVLRQFEQAIDAREAVNQKVDNRLLDIEESRLISARLDGSEAEIGVLFKADLIAVTRDESGTVIAGDASGSVVVKDEWTFRRDLKSSQPAWLLVATRTA